MNKQKILLVSHAYVAEENLRKPELMCQDGAVQICVVTPNRWQTAHGESKEVSDKTLTSNLSLKALPVYFSGNGGRYFFHKINLIRLFKQFRPNTVHIEEEPWTLSSLEVALFSKIFSCKLVLFTWENLEVGMNFWQRLIEKMVLRSADLVIAGNTGAKERIKHHGFKKEIKILPQFGVNTDVFRPLDVAELKKELGLFGFTIGFVGRFVEEKGIKLLIESLSYLPQDTSLLLVSSSQQLPTEFENFAKSLNIFNRIKIVSGIPHYNLAKFYNCMDVFILPSITTKTWKEQFGRVLIEAMSCKVPVIGSSSGAIPEVIGQAGLTFKEGGAQDLASAITRLKSNEVLRNELADRGYRRALDDFTFEVIARKTLAIYDSTLSNDLTPSVR